MIIASAYLFLPDLSFKASFASFATFDNDEHTRTSLGLEVGAGHSEVQDFLLEGISVLTYL